MKNPLVCVLTLILLATGTSAFASGTLYDLGVMQMTFPDYAGSTRISADNDGSYIWTASGGSHGGPRIARHNQDGSLSAQFSPGIDFRSIFVSNGGVLHSKEYGAGNIHQITQSGVPTLLFVLGDPESQSSASFNGPDTEIYTMSAPTLRRFNAANGALIGTVALQGMSGGETAYPDNVQMETNSSGRILTYSNGVVSEWDLGGIRIGQCTIPISTPTGFETEFSFGVGNDDYVYLYNEATGMWETYDIGIGMPTAVEPTTWSRVKNLYR